MLCHDILSQTTATSGFNEKGGYIGIYIGAWRHLGYGIPELSPDYS
jgi:hypothetical protein